MCRTKGTAFRNQIYCYLETHLSFSRQTIVSKIKKVRLQQDELKVRKCYKKFKSIIDEEMLKILQNNEAECKNDNNLRISSGPENGNIDIINKKPKKHFHWTLSLR